MIVIKVKQHLVNIFFRNNLQVNKKKNHIFKSGSIRNIQK